MGKVIFSSQVLQQLEDLALILFYKDYFSYQSNALLYVDNILEYVENSISTFPHKITSKALLHLGANYIFYKTNARTTWYIFFEKNKASYLVTGILNNHCSEAQLI